MKKALIEEQSVELLELFEKVSEEAKKEKNAVPPINKMVYYWTRKPLVVSRTVLLVSTINDVDSAKEFLQLSRDNRAYTSSVSIKNFKEKLGYEPSTIKILDPFGGTGNLMFEAKRFGFDCMCSDYNPLSYIIQKSILEYPSKYGTKLIDYFEKYSKKTIDITQKEIGKFYTSNHLDYLWLWCVKCPHCNQRVPLTNQMWIVNTPKKKIGMRFCITSDKNFKVEIIQNMTTKEGKSYTQKNGVAKCISCKNAIDYQALTNDISKRKDREMIVILIQTNKKRDYIIATNEDKELYKKAEEYFLIKEAEFQKENLIPNEPIRAAHRKEYHTWHYGVNKWRQFFNPRQILFLCTFLKNIKKTCNEIKDQELAGAIAIYLGFLLCKIVNHNSYGAVWNPVGQKLQHALSFREPRVVFNNVEINPFVKTAGALPNGIKNITDAILFASQNKSDLQISLTSVFNLPLDYSKKFDLIITDPPYGDDVHYAEQSDFFYIWLIRVIKKFFPKLPDLPPVEEDVCETWGRFGDKKLAEDFFEKSLKKSFVSMNHILKDDGLLVVFFAHSSTKAWNMLLESIIESKFKVVSSYAIHTENVSNVIARNKTSFMSSILVACRKVTKESTAYFEDIIPQTEDNIKNMIQKIPVEKLLTLQITDLLIMVYGKVLETCTQFTELKSYEKDFKGNFQTVILNSQGFIMKAIIAKLTNRSLNSLGMLTAFYLITKIFYHGIMSSDDALKVARTYGMDLDVLEKNNIGEKEGNTIRLFYLHENELDLKPEEIDRNVLHQQLCYLVQVTKKQGASKTQTILSSAKNFRADDLKQIILLLIQNFRLRINKNEKLNDDEKEELQILEAISDVMGIKTTTKTKGGLDQYFEN